MKKLLIICLSLFWVNSYASLDEIKKVTVTPVDTPQEVYSQIKGDGITGAISALGDIIAVGDSLVAFGTAILQIIQDNAPATDLQFVDPISVLPKLEGDMVSFYDVENWSAPKTKSYRVAFENGFGSEVVGFTYTIHFQHSGTYRGTGAYLLGIRVLTSNVHAKWGFKLNASSKLISIANRGAKTNPLAGVTIQVDYQAKSFLKEIRNTEVFHILGDGKIQKIKL